MEVGTEEAVREGQATEAGRKAVAWEEAVGDSGLQLELEGGWWAEEYQEEELEMGAILVVAETVGAALAAVEMAEAGSAVVEEGVALD